MTDENTRNPVPLRWELFGFSVGAGLSMLLWLFPTVWLLEEAHAVWGNWFTVPLMALVAITGGVLYFSLQRKIDRLQNR